MHLQKSLLPTTIRIKRRVFTEIFTFPQMHRSSSTTRKLLSRRLASLDVWHRERRSTGSFARFSGVLLDSETRFSGVKSDDNGNVRRHSDGHRKDFLSAGEKRFVSADAFDFRVSNDRKRISRDDVVVHRQWTSTRASSTSSSSSSSTSTTEKSNSKKFTTSSARQQQKQQKQNHIKHSRFTSKPKSLAIPFESTSEVFEVPEKRATTLPWYTRFMLKIGGYDSSESVQNRASQRLFKAVVERCDEEKFYQVLGLEHSFRTEHAMFVLHVWLVLARLRREGDSGKAISQMFYDTFQEEVEKRVHREGVKVRVRSTLKEWEQSFYGSALAYEKALSSGNDDFMKALRRNVFMNEGDEKSAKALERYCRREMACLHITETEAVVSGRVRFSSID